MRSSGPLYTPLPPMRRAPNSAPPRFGHITKAALRVYITLAYEMWRADDAGWLVFSPSQLAAETGIPRNTMFDGLRDLARRGHIERGRRGRFTTARLTQPEQFG